MTTNMAGNKGKRILALAAVLCMIFLTGCVYKATGSDDLILLCEMRLMIKRLVLGWLHILLM